MITLHAIEPRFNVPCAIFRIPTSSQGDVFLRAELPAFCAGNTSVVEVQRNEFLNLWRNDTFEEGRTLANGDVPMWRADRKYLDAEDGFKGGFANPVPLARVVAGIRQEWSPVFRRKWGLFRYRSGVESTSIPYASFENGITRTIWLLSAGVERFPVLIDTADAQFLAQRAGVPGQAPATLEQLIGEGRHCQT